MQTDNIRITTNDRIQTITLCRPDKKNAVTQAMYGALADAIQAYGKDEHLRALIITGEGDYFTAGNDLLDFATSQSSQSHTGEELPNVVRFLFALTACEKPLIAAVNGPGIGIGLTLLLHCDLSIAAQSATLSAPFVRLAVVPEAASSQLLAKHVGMAMASDLLLTGRILNAQEAQQCGLVSRVVPDQKFSEEVMKAAQHLADSSPTALRKSKALIRHDRGKIRDLMRKEIAVFDEQLRSEDFKESVAALMQKRPPAYK